MLNPVTRTQLFKLADKIKTDLNGNSRGSTRNELQFWRVDERELAALSELIQASLNLSVPPFAVVDGIDCISLETLNPLTIGVETEPDSWAIDQVVTASDLIDPEARPPYPLKYRAKWLIIERIDLWLDLIEQVDQSATATNQRESREESGGSETTDELLTALFEKNPSAKKWSQRQLAGEINKSKGSVAKSKVYRCVSAEINECKAPLDAELFGNDI